MLGDSSHSWLIPDATHTNFGYSISGADILLIVNMAVVLDDHSPEDSADELKISLAKEDWNLFVSRWAPHVIRDSDFLLTFQFNWS